MKRLKINNERKREGVIDRDNETVGLKQREGERERERERERKGIEREMYLYNERSTVRQKKRWRERPRQ